MRSTLIAVIGSLVLAFSTVMIVPVDVEAKAKWPMVWQGGQKAFTSKPFVVANRPGTDTQHQYGVVSVRKKKGRGPCVARFNYFQAGFPGPWDFKLENRTRRPVAQAAVWQWDTKNAPRRVRMQVRIKTNGNCGKWAITIMGPRKGPGPDLGQ